MYILLAIVSYIKAYFNKNMIRSIDDDDNNVLLNHHKNSNDSLSSLPGSSSCLLQEEEDYRLFKVMDTLEYAVSMEETLVATNRALLRTLKSAGVQFLRYTSIDSYKNL